MKFLSPINFKFRPVWIGLSDCPCTNNSRAFNSMPFQHRIDAIRFQFVRNFAKFYVEWEQPRGGAGNHVSFFDAVANRPNLEIERQSVIERFVINRWR